MLVKIGTWRYPVDVSKYGENRSQQLDFVKRATEADVIKVKMRQYYVRAVNEARGENKEVFLKRSKEFWEEYDDVNTKLTPEDPVYTGTRAGITLATNTDAWTLVYPTGSASQCRILESFIGGESAASTVLRLAIQISTTGTTITTQTPEKMSSRSPAAGFRFATTWGTQPTLSGVAMIFQAFNTFGGTDRFVPVPGAEPTLVNAEQISARSALGVPVVSTHVIWEEL